MMKLTARPRPVDSRTDDELGLIAEHRMSHPAPPGTARPVIRAAVPADRRAIEEMTARCSPETLRRRFHGSVGDPRPAHVADLLSGATRLVLQLVAEVDGAVVGVASLHRNRHGDGELAVLVEDAWQGTGLGSRLTGRLVRGACEQGVSTVVADVMREPAFVLEHLHRAMQGSSVDFDGPIATVRIPVSMGACTPAPAAT